MRFTTIIRARVNIYVIDGFVIFSRMITSRTFRLIINRKSIFYFDLISDRSWPFLIFLNEQLATLKNLLIIIIVWSV